MTPETSTKDAKTFREIYDNLPPREFIAPKKEFVREIAELCKCAESTVRCWLAGVQQPDTLKKSLIAEKLGVSEDILFPKEVTEENYSVK